MNKRLRTIFQFIFFIGLGIFLVWWSVKDLTAEDRSEIRFALRHARYWLIGPVFLILLGSHYIRAYRWKLLIDSLGYKTRSTNTFFAVMIGYLANQAFPRLGEVLKCTVVSRYEEVPVDKLVGTIILERLIDAITLLIVFGVTLAIQPHIYGELMNAFFNPGNAQKDDAAIPGYVFLLIVIGLILVATALWMIIRKKNFADLRAALSKIIHRVLEGIGAIRHLRKRGLFILLTVLLWAAYLFGGYLGFFALQQTQHFGIPEAFTVLSAGSVGMIVTPGGIGAYAFLLQRTMTIYGLHPGVSLAFGWLLWLAQFAVIVLGGLVSFVAIPWYNKRKKSEAS